MSGTAGTDARRHRMERALAALAGSGLDSARFAVVLDPALASGEIGEPGYLDRSMTAVLAVRSGGLEATLGRLAPEGLVAWVADPCADPDLDPATADEVIGGQVVDTAAELAAGPPPDAADAAGWLVVAAEAPAEATDVVLLAALEAAIERGASPSRAAKAVAAEFGVPKRRVYDLGLSGDTARQAGPGD